jgi:hypothetical protein
MGIIRGYKDESLDMNKRLKKIHARISLELYEWLDAHGYFEVDFDYFIESLLMKHIEQMNKDKGYSSMED